MKSLLMKTPFVVLTAGLMLAPTVAAAQSKEGDKGRTEVSEARPIDRRSVPLSEEFRHAIENGTRVETGHPGNSYWQQWARYDISAQLDPPSGILSGSESIWYFNRSPDSLDEVFLHLRPNLFSPKSERNTNAPTSGGVTLGDVAVNGLVVFADVEGTILRLPLDVELRSGDSVFLELEWSYPVPPNAPRSGFDGEVYFLAYWYPQMAVYDDLAGWNIDQYLGNAEFYMGYGDYRYEVTVPAGYLVGATGELTNSSEVLTDRAMERLAGAREKRQTVNVVSPAEQGPGGSTRRGEDGTLTWRYEARNVRDVTWSTSDSFVWDATHAVVGDIEGDGIPDTTAIHSFYRAESTGWLESARFSQASIELLSEYLWPYPYEHMTAVEGPSSCGGMEYPMMTCIGTGAFNTPESMYNVTEHEIGHMWFPMQVGSNEKAHAWMDEGLTQFNEIPGMEDMFPNSDVRAQNRNIYLSIVNAGMEEPLMVHGDRYESDFGYGVASYFKPANAFVALNKMLGDELFLEALREFGRRWVGKHPAPWDLWNTFDDVTGRDLGWFWRSWFFETWALDQAIGSVEENGAELVVTLTNLGEMVMPAYLSVEYADGTRQEFVAAVDGWLDDELEVVVTVPRGSDVVSMELDIDVAFPDTDRSNQSWTP